MIGQTISHYRILAKLGGGGMGVVYKAEDNALKRTVALKFLPPALTLDPDAQERFVHEARAASALDHSNICTIHEVGHTEDGQTFIVMACYEGQTLKQKIEQGPLDIDLALDIAIQIAEGLARAHEAGIVHRDIKPANIFITSHNEVKILDFGLAKLSGQTMLTKTGSTLGTAAYMSPEQARGESVDHRTDVWSLGVVMYEMLTGRRPFESDYEQALIYSILNENPKPIRQSRPDVPEVVEQIVARTMGKNFEDRYQQVSEFLADLKIARGKEEAGGTIAAAEAMKKRGRKSLIRRVAAMCAVALVLAVLFFVVRPMISDEAIASNPKTVFVISFENQTGDKDLNYLRTVIPSLLITSLEQSKFFQVITPERTYDILKQIGKKGVDFIDRDLGMEICRRERADAMVVGSYTRAGNLFVTDLKILDAGTLQPIGKGVRTNGQGVESILKTQVDELAKGISRGIGVSRVGTAQTLMPVVEITTSSLEAYNLYVRGVQEFAKWNFPEARRYLELAVQKDSLFAAAWCDLSNACLGMDDPKGAEHARKNASALAERASEKERYMIANFDTTLRASLLGSRGTNDLDFARTCAQRYPAEKSFFWHWGYLAQELGKGEEAFAAFTGLLELDPFYPPALNHLGYYYASKGDTARAAEMFQRLAAASPGDPNPYDSMGDFYFGTGREDDAIASYRQALAVKPDFPSASKIASIYFFREEYEKALSLTDSAIARSSAHPQKAEIQWRQALYFFWIGRLTKAESVLRERATVLKTLEMHDAQGEFLEAWIAFERGDFARSRSLLYRWRPMYIAHAQPFGQPLAACVGQWCIGFVDLGAGRLDSVEWRLGEMDRIASTLPDSGLTAGLSTRSKTWRNILAAKKLLVEGRAQEALDLAPRDRRSSSCRPMQLYTGRWEMIDLTQIPVMVDHLPAAYLATGNTDSAISIYERAVAHSSFRMSPIFPRYHYRLARLYEQKGMNQKAIAEYEKFLKIWGKADPIYKEPADARARLAKLKGARL